MTDTDFTFATITDDPDFIFASTTDDADFSFNQVAAAIGEALKSFPGKVQAFTFRGLTQFWSFAGKAQPFTFRGKIFRDK